MFAKDFEGRRSGRAFFRETPVTGVSCYSGEVKVMNTIQQELTQTLSAAFSAAGYDAALGEARLSDRPELGDYQCNGALAAAKRYHKAPLVIAEEVTGAIPADAGFSAEIVRPGFINLKVSPSLMRQKLAELSADADLGIPKKAPKKIVLDYGGPNVAKPLHIGHLRSAVIGESLKRILRAVGCEVLGDVHLGDWGLQMGLVINELRHRNPELPYFDPDFKGEYPEEAPFTISELEELYPFASAKSKTDEAYRAEAMEATHLLQSGDPGYRALWKKIMEVSVADLKRNYQRLDVTFDLWKGESDVQPRLAPMVEKMVADGIAVRDQGALVVDVSEPTDKKELPPCIVQKSDGAALYSTTDLATIAEREELYAPDAIIYVVDKRQAMHFTQVFRTARKAGLVREGTELTHVGFGTMNGKDGTPFKTREGGVMRLETLLNEVNEEMIGKIRENKNVRAEDAEATADMVSLAAIKYGDLWNQASKDYIFDIEKFASFEGNTGPYILYTIVRISSILEKAGVSRERGALTAFKAPESAAEKDLVLTLLRFGETVEKAAEELAPHKICAYVYGLANAFNRFYHETKILSEPDEGKRAGYLALLSLSYAVLTRAIELLGFAAPEHM